MTDEREVLSALIDREPVDADVLSGVLDAPANRELLVDLIRLRQRVITDDDTPVAAPGARVGSLAPGRSWTPPTWVRAAAVLLLLAASAGGGVVIERYFATERPPQPSRVVQMDPIAVQPGVGR